MLQDQYRAVMQYSKNPHDRIGGTPGRMLAQDWNCIRCGGHNFKNRSTCFTCHVPRPEAEDLAASAIGLEEISPVPTSTILLRGLDPISTEDTVLAAVKPYISLVPLRSIHIGRDPLTNQARGVCYLELRSVVDSMFLFQALALNPPVIDGRRVLVSYCKMMGVDVGAALAISAANSAALAAAQMNHHQLLLQQQQVMVAQHHHQQQAAAAAAIVAHHHQQQQQAAAAALLGSGHAPGAQYTLEDVPRLAEYSANMYANTPEERAAFLQYYQQYYTTQIAEGSAITLPVQVEGGAMAAAAAHQVVLQQMHAAAAAAVAAAKDSQDEAKNELLKKLKGSANKSNVGKLAVEQAQAAAAAQNQSALRNATDSSSSGKPLTGPQPRREIVDFVNTKHPPPNVSTYQYDESSGYYYDASTGLYFDPNSQYYWNAQTHQFMYWDSERSTYLPAPTDAGQDGSLANGNGSKDDPGSRKEGKKGEKSDKVKVAKKIAKDMERWAKSQNQRKNMNQANLPSSNIPEKSGAADAGFAILEGRSKVNLTMANQAPLMDSGNNSPNRVESGNLSNAANSALVAAYGGGSESEEEIEDVQQEERQHLDWSKLACLLCKRQFPSRDALSRHQLLSDLHKQNLETWYRSRGLDPNDPQQRNNKYRDRAKERRLKYGEPDKPNPNRLKEKYLKSRQDSPAVYEEPTKAGIGADNKGNRLLQKMGWQEGMGLGKSNQGRTTIIQAEQRVSTAGLGSKQSTYTPLPGETYKDCVKKMMFARYHELSEQENGGS